MGKLIVVLLDLALLIILVKTQASLIYMAKNTDFATGEILYQNPYYQSAGSPTNVIAAYPAGFVTPAAPIFISTLRGIYLSGDLPYENTHGWNPINHIFFEMYAANLNTTQV